MFTEFHGLSENPFTIMPDPRLAWLGAGMREVRAQLCKAVLEGRSLMLLSGGPGVGKSLMLTLLASDLKQSGAPCSIHALNCGLQISVTELFRRIAEDTAGAAATDRLTVLLVDEAQHLGAAELGALLQEAAMRSDRLRLVLAGAPDFELAVKQALAAHPATITAHWSLEPLPPEEISSYIAGRLQAAGGGGRDVFTANAIECLIRHSGGVPRRLNVLCSTALFLAWREGRRDVDASIVEAALPIFSSTEGPLTDAAAPRPSTVVRAPAQVSLIETAVVPEVKSLPTAEVELPAREASARPVVSDDGRPEVVEIITAPTTQSQSMTNSPAAVAVRFASREIAQLQPTSRAVVARENRPVPDPSGPRMRRRLALYVPVAGLAGIALLLGTFDWRARDQQPTTVTPTNPSTITTTNQSIAVRVYVDPQFAEEGPQSATEGQPPRETIGSAELAELLLRAHQQIEAFALTTPAGDNAFETLRRVLAAMPAQPDALQGIHDIASRYAVLAAQAERRGEHDLAQRYVDKGLGVVPDHPDLLAVQEKLAAVQQKLAAPSDPGRLPTRADRFRMAPNGPAGTTK